MKRLEAVMGTLLALTAVAQAAEVSLSDLDISKTKQGWREPARDFNLFGKRLSVAGKTYQTGLATHANSTLYVRLNGATRFQALAGVDDTRDQPGKLRFQVIADGRIVWQSPLLGKGDAPVAVDVDLTGYQTALLRVDQGPDGNSGDHADWLEAKFITESAKKPEALDDQRWPDLWISSLDPAFAIPEQAVQRGGLRRRGLLHGTGRLGRDHRRRAPVRRQGRRRGRLARETGVHPRGRRQNPLGERRDEGRRRPETV